MPFKWQNIDFRCESQRTVEQRSSKRLVDASCEWHLEFSPFLGSYPLFFVLGTGPSIPGNSFLRYSPWRVLHSAESFPVKKAKGALYLSSEEHDSDVLRRWSSIFPSKTLEFLQMVPVCFSTWFLLSQEPWDATKPKCATSCSTALLLDS